MLELDGIDEQEIYARHEYGDATTAVRLRDLFFRQFDPANVGCPILYARPMTFHYCGSGNIGDNGQTAFYCRAEDICDGTTGLREETGNTHAHEFWADVQWFSRRITGAEIVRARHSHEDADTDGHEMVNASPLLDDVPEDAKLVCYIIAATSVPRIKINGTWKVVSPCYFPPYGDPYGMVNRGFKSIIADHGLRFGVDDINEIVVEHFSTRGDQCGAQVIFCLQWEETESIIIEKIKKRRRRMSLTHDHKRAFIRKMIEFTEENEQALKDAGYDPSQRIGELTTLNDAQEQAEAEQLAAMAALKGKTQASNDALDVAYKNASALVELFVGFLGKEHPLVEVLKNIRDLMIIEEARGKEKEPEKPEEKPQ